MHEYLALCSDWFDDIRLSSMSKSNRLSEVTQDCNFFNSCLSPFFSFHKFAFFHLLWNMIFSIKNLSIIEEAGK